MDEFAEDYMYFACIKFINSVSILTAQLPSSSDTLTSLVASCRSRPHPCDGTHRCLMTSLASRLGQRSTRACKRCIEPRCCSNFRSHSTSSSDPSSSRPIYRKAKRKRWERKTSTVTSMDKSMARERVKRLGGAIAAEFQSQVLLLRQSKRRQSPRQRAHMLRASGAHNRQSAAFLSIENRFCSLVYIWYSCDD